MNLNTKKDITSKDKTNKHNFRVYKHAYLSKIPVSFVSTLPCVCAAHTSVEQVFMWQESQGSLAV